MDLVEEKAIVDQVEGDFVYVETLSQQSCASCPNKTGCGNLSTLFSLKKKNKLKVTNTLNLEEGDSVLIGMAPNKLLKATVLMYMSPLLLLFLFSLIAKLFMSESASMLAGLIGLFFGLFLVNFYSKNKAVSEQFQPVLIRKIISIDAV